MNDKKKFNITFLYLVVSAILLSGCSFFDKNKKQDDSNNENESGEISDSFIYFGSYPQTEVVGNIEDSGVFDKEWASENDYIVDQNTYNTLQNLSENKWDVNGDTILNGVKYRRINGGNAVYSTADDVNFYQWENKEKYHYFKFETIKWRILQKTNDEAFLLSDIALDTQKYNSNITNLTWETSTIRSWLNGYNATNNDYGTDYSENNFLNTAFSLEEQNRIKTSTLINNDNSKSGIEGGNDTNDKIFLLSEDEAYGTTGNEFGFAVDYDEHDALRQIKSSTYAKAMGAYVDNDSETSGNCWWWLRSPGSYTGLFILVRCNGSVYRGGQHANSKTRCVCPALRISL